MSSDESARRALPEPRLPRVDLRISLVDGTTSVPWRYDPTLEGRDADDVLRAARAAVETDGIFVVGGGEPLRRPDSRELLTEIACLKPGIAVATFGHGLTAAVAGEIRAAGIERLHVPFHCARQDAHDWLVGQPGALKTAHRAMRRAIEAGLAVTAEVAVTRPTAAHLAETIEVLARLGVKSAYVRRLTAHDADPTLFVPLSPRMALLRESLERAAQVALTRRVRLSLRDLPLCAAPRLRPLFAQPGSELWVLPDGTTTSRTAPAIGCATCPGLPQCAGAPADYVSRFGWEEFTQPETAVPRIHETVADQKAPVRSQPMTFGWRGPRRVRCEACADVAAESSHAERPYESTRFIRARLVEAARYRPSMLRLVGADLLAHPQAALLVYDALRLFPHVEIAGEASAIVDWSDLDLRRLKDLKRIDVALYGPDAATHDAHCGIPGAFAAMLRAVERLGRANVTVGAYAIAHDARSIPAFADAWARRALPGEPRFRLSADGPSLAEIGEHASALPAGPARSALLAALPGRGDDDSPADERQQRIRAGRSMVYEPCGSDPIGFGARQENGTHGESRVVRGRR